MIGFIGVGNMGGAVVKALLDSGEKDVIVSNRSLDRLEAFDCEKTTDNRELVEKSNVVVLCVKPKGIADILEEIKDLLDDKLIVSIAAGKTMAYMESIIGIKPIARVIPSMGSLVGFGSTGYALNSACISTDEETIKKIFSPGAALVRVKEELIDCIAYINARPGLLAKEIEVEEDELSKQGLSKDDYRKLIANVLRATAEYVEGGEPYDSLYKKVASPGGMTEAAHLRGEEIKFYEGIRERVRRALERAKEMG